MDVKFLESVVESFLIDNDIYSKSKNLDESEKIKEQLFREVLQTVIEFRQTDNEGYEQLYQEPRSSQRKVLNLYLEYYCNENDEEILQEMFEPVTGTLGGIILGGIALTTLIFGWLGVRKPVSRGAMRVLNAIAKGFDELGKFLSKISRGTRFRYAIINKNAEECYKEKCRINPKDIGPDIYVNVRRRTEHLSYEGKQAQCLVECYLNNLIEMIALLLSIYFNCLKDTGEFSKIKDLRDDDLLKITTGMELSKSCHVYYKHVKKSFDNFYELLDFVFSDKFGVFNKSEKHRYINKLQETLVKERNKSKNNQQNQNKNNFRR